MNDARAHYLSGDIDRRFIEAARDALIPFVRGPRVVNVGLGYGAWDAWIAERFSQSADQPAYGVDIDAALVAHFRQTYPAIRYVCADATAWSPDAPFDTICASHLLEHLDDPIAALRHWKARWLRPGGRVIAVVPNADSLHRQVGEKMGLLASRTDLNDGDRMLGHRRVYTTALLRDHVTAAGLVVEHLETLTMKPLSNAQLSAMPPAYVDACLAMRGDALGALGCQIAAVLTVSDLS